LVVAFFVIMLETAVRPPLYSDHLGPYAILIWLMAAAVSGGISAVASGVLVIPQIDGLKPLPFLWQVCRSEAG
jgi:hypothetical protein